MKTPRLTRRRLLEGTAGLSVAGLAGCLGSPSDSGPPGAEDSPSPTESEHSEDDDSPGHGDDAHDQDMVSEPKASREVALSTTQTAGSTEYHFTPHVTWVEVGGTVTWRLESGTHSTTAYHPDNDQPQLVPDGTEAWDSGLLSEEGATFEHTFETEGVYHYYCIPHESVGMLATVIVGKPHLDDQPALQTMPANKPEAVQKQLEELNTMVREIMGEGHEEDDPHEESTVTDE